MCDRRAAAAAAAERDAFEARLLRKAFAAAVAAEAEGGAALIPCLKIVSASLSKRSLSWPDIDMINAVLNYDVLDSNLSSDVWTSSA